MSVDVTALAVKVESTGIREASQALGGLSTSAANSEKRITAFTSAMEKLNTVSNTSVITMSSYMQKLQQQATLMQGLNADSKGAASSTAALASAMALLSASLAALAVQTKAATVAQANHSAGMKEAHALARGLSGSLGALWLTYGNFAGMATGLAIGASLKGIVTVGKDVENTLEGIRVKGQETIESIAKLRVAIADLGKGIYGPQDIAKAFETMILAGLSAKQALSGISDALNLATVGGTSIEKSAYTIVQVGTALGYAAENYGRIADVIAMTAAVSMSSVETLSEAFKSGSVVGKLYGVTLVDIGTSLAALSNLGIQGSAAGTSLKNFYKELASSSEKVKNTLKGMKLVPEDFKDAQGNYKGVLEVVETLAKGLDNLTASQQKLAIANLSNERGMKTAIELLDLYKQKTDLATASGAAHGTMLGQLRAKIEDSYGFAAIGAAQMSLTIDAQFKSVANTLKTVFLGAFQQISPEMNTIATSLKDAFNSPEFINGIKELAIGVAKLTVVLVENIPLITKFVLALLVAKSLVFVIELFTSIGVAFRALAAGAALANIALGPIAIALMAAGAAYAYFSRERDSSNMSTSQQTALKYSADYAVALEKEAARLNEQLRLMKEGKNARDAETESIMTQQLALAKLQGDKAKAEAETRLERAGTNVTLKDIEISESIVKRGGFLTAAVKEYKLAQQNLIVINKQVDESYARIQAGQKAVMDSAKALEAERKRIADAEPKTTGTGTIAKEDKKGELDALNAKLQQFQNQINEAKKQAEVEKKIANSEYKQGLIGETTLIQRIYEADTKFAKGAVDNIKSEIAALEGKKGKLTEIERLRGKLAIVEDTIGNADIVRTNALAERAVKIEEETQKAIAEAYTRRGQFVNAFLANEASKHETYSKQLQDEYDRATDALERFRLKTLITANEAAATAGLYAASAKEASNAFDVLNTDMTNVLKGVKTASENKGWAAMWEAASKAADEYRAKLPALVEAQKASLDAAKLSGDPAAIAKAQAQLASIATQAEHFKQMWSGVGDSISKSLESAFGRGGKALGDLTKIAIEYSNQETHNGVQQVKTYGDMAQAAQGFFSEGSSGYRAMGVISTAFHAAELAMNLASIGPALAAGAANMFAQSGWGGFAGVAAMLALMATLGFSGGGGSIPTAADRQASAGAGSVLGDDKAKSESIAKSISVLEKNSGLGLAQGSSMIGYLKQVSDNISGLASLVVRATGISSGKVDGVTEGTSLSTAGKLVTLVGGGVIGALVAQIPLVGNILNKLFGSTTTVIDQGIKLTKATLENVQAVGLKVQSYADINETSKFFGFTISNSTSTQLKAVPQDISDQFNLIIKNMSATISSAATMLGVGGDAFTEHLNQFVIDIGNISVKGLTGDQIEKQFQAVFSKLGDDMAQFAIGGLSQFQKVGEGYLETLARVANDFIQVKDVFAVLGKALNATGVDAVKVSEGLIAAAGSIEALTSGTKFFVDNFLTEQEKMDPIVKSVSDRLAQLGLSELTTVELYKKKVQALDLTNAADQKMYAALIELAPAFKTAADYTNKVVEAVDILSKQHELDLRLMEALGNTSAATAIRRQDEIDALNKLSPALGATQAAIYAATDASALATEQAAAAKKASEELAAAQAAQVKAVADAEQKIRDGYTAQEAKIAELIKANMTLATQRQMELNALDATGKSLQGVIYVLEDAAKITAERKAAEEALATTNKGLSDQIDSLLKASMSLEGQRQVELVGLDSSSVALKKRLFALQDEASAAAAAKTANDALQATYKGLQDQVDQLVKAALPIEKQRELEVAGLDGTAKALQLRIYTLQDEAKAVANASIIASQKHSLDIQLMEALGDAEGALAIKRKDELAALDDSLQATQKAIYAAQDAAVAQTALKAAQDATAAVDAQRVQLQIKIMQESGDAAGAMAAQRQLELNALDNSLKPLQLYIYALQDAATSEAAAASEQARLNGIATQRRTLEIALMEAQGNTVGALAAKRADELAAMDSSLRSIQQNINDTTDANAAAAASKAAMDTYLAAVKARQDSQLQMEIKILELAGNSVASVSLQRSIELAAMDESLRPFQQRIYDLTDENALTVASNAIKAKQRALDIQLMTALGDAAGALAATRHDELAALDASLRPTQLAIYAAQDKAKADSEATAAATAYATSVEKAKSNLKDAYDRESAAMRDTIKNTEDFIKSLKSFRDQMLLSDQSILDPLAKYNEAKKQLANSSPEDFQSSAKNFLDASKGYYASSEQYAKDFNYVQDLIENNISTASRHLDIATSQLAKLDASVAGLITVNTSVLSVVEAIRELRTVLAPTSSTVASATPSSTSSPASSSPSSSSGAGGAGGWNPYWLNSDHVAETLAKIQRDPVSGGFDVLKEMVTTGGVSSASFDAATKALGVDNVTKYFGVSSTPDKDIDWNALQRKFNINTPQNNISGGIDAEFRGFHGRDAENAASMELLGGVGGINTVNGQLVYTSTGRFVDESLNQGPNMRLLRGVNDGLFQRQFNTLDGAHYNGLDKVPHDNYVGLLHEGEKVKSAASVRSDERTNAELIAINRELLEKLTAIVGASEASVRVGVASAELLAEKLDVIADKTDAVKRKVAAQ